ncbi:MAG: FAD:protein FMN transferase [Actinobacteria bacterium]|nr:FAD:protein FMN transferase [Actinomycetota bacterium]
MGSDVSVVIVTDRRDLLGVAVSRIDDLERRWSRFLSASEISNINRNAGRPVKVTADTRLLVQTAIEAWGATGGAFDPLVGESVIAAGYNRTIDEVRTGAPAPIRSSTASAGCGGIEVDARAGTVAIPAGTRFDPGGLGKGLAADLLAAELLAAGALGACVELGGDVRVTGLGPELPETEHAGESGWSIGIADPFAPDTDAVVASLAEGAVATSSTLKRRWRTTDGGEAHHLIDPRTGRPATSPVVTATIIAGNGATAEVLATAAIVAGSQQAEGMIEALGAAGLLVEAGGSRTVVGALEAFLTEPFPLDGERAGGGETADGQQAVGMT